MLLFCIPHAGGSSLSYLRWKKSLYENIIFTPLDLPGHITRPNSPLLDDFYLVLDDLYRNLLEKVTDYGGEYAVFGHSSGAVFAYELFKKLEAEGKRLPIHLFFSGRWPPYLIKEEKRKFTDFDDFKKNFPISKNFFNMSESNDELGDYYYKVIYSDLKLLDTYTHSSTACRISSEITVMWGTNDESMGYKDVSAWKASAAGKINFQAIDGSHLFPTENVEDTVGLINKVLAAFPIR